MATYNNDLRLKEITTGDEDGTWGDSTNTNLSLIADAFGLGTKQMAADANETFTIPDATADSARSLYLKITSAVSLTATRTVTLGPNTVSKLWVIENATSGSQSIVIAQGSGSTVTVPAGSKMMVVSDGAGAGAAVSNANPTEVGGTVTSVAVSGGTTGLTTSGGPITSSGTITFAGTLAVANGGTGITSFGTGVATALGQNVTGSGGIVLATGGAVSGLTLNDGYTEEVFALGTSGALTLEPDNGSIQTCALAGAPTFSDGLSAGQSIVLMLTNGASYTVTWPTITWVTSAGNVAPTLTANDVLVFWKVGSTMYGAYVGSGV